MAAIHRSPRGKWPAQQFSLLTECDAHSPDAPATCQARLRSLTVRKPRQYGACWLGCRFFEAHQLNRCCSSTVANRRGTEDWAEVVELLTVNRLRSSGSELSVHERCYSQTVIDVLLDPDAGIAGKDRLYRALEKIVVVKGLLEQHLAQRWVHLFNAQPDILFYDFTSSYFKGSADENHRTAHGGVVRLMGGGPQTIQADRIGEDFCIKDGHSPAEVIWSDPSRLR